MVAQTVYLYFFTFTFSPLPISRFVGTKLRQNVRSKTINACALYKGTTSISCTRAAAMVHESYTKYVVFVFSVARFHLHLLDLDLALQTLP